MISKQTCFICLLRPSFRADGNRIKSMVQRAFKCCLLISNLLTWLTSGWSFSRQTNKAGFRPPQQWLLLLPPAGGWAAIDKFVRRRKPWAFVSAVATELDRQLGAERRHADVIDIRTVLDDRWDEGCVVNSVSHGYFSARCHQETAVSAAWRRQRQIDRLSIGNGCWMATKDEMERRTVHFNETHCPANST